MSDLDIIHKWCKDRLCKQCEHQEVALGVASCCFCAEKFEDIDLKVANTALEKIKKEMACESNQDEKICSSCGATGDKLHDLACDL